MSTKQQEKRTCGCLATRPPPHEALLSAVASEGAANAMEATVRTAKRSLKDMSVSSLCAQDELKEKIGCRH